MRIIEEMENEQVVIVIKDKAKLNILNKCCIKAQMFRNIYGNLENIKAASIMVLWHIMDFIKPISKGGKRRLTSMSNIYMQEPPTMAKVITMTLYFIHKVLIPQVQEKVVKYMENHLRTNFLQELRSYGRGLIAVANAGKDDNTSQFLFTLSSTSELQSKHTIFDKVTGETIYNMLILEKAPVDENDRLLYPPRLLKYIILNNPFTDIIPRIIVLENEEVKDSSKAETVAVKDFNLLSFGEEAEEDNGESVILSKKFRGKASQLAII
ncbi:Peptidyl-prolyl cis-trans isomerase CWC27 like protein [Eufriesea mexicana]|uniref:Spliceosome-associated protein CWC27 homolog n=1 Tax=Eufriesea mexicana TaxID=516756 RepID=A0A310SDW8_9HYME|nr:Peptidyl-prolyl cis-trans isomerase CWC27 like protein [Eufriesea mexicana]